MSDKRPHLVPKWIIICFFILGLFSALSFRAVIVVRKIEPSFVRPVWYCGALGYMLFFLYRTYIARKRKAAINQYQLVEKLQSNSSLSNEDREVLKYLLASLKKSPEEFNYFLIFLFSIVAILLDLII
ncbi:MAG: hypothetical protein D6710_01585 [Nitrospirae bacterium]|nr:MAG: hypothetical protein D6710_01585 [Nitrospirota bacterium]